MWESYHGSHHEALAFDRVEQSEWRATNLCLSDFRSVRSRSHFRKCPQEFQLVISGAQKLFPPPLSASLAWISSSSASAPERMTTFINFRRATGLSPSPTLR